jgi:hypothetical protein
LRSWLAWPAPDELVEPVEPVAPVELVVEVVEVVELDVGGALASVVGEPLVVVVLWLLEARDAESAVTLAAFSRAAAVRGPLSPGGAPPGSGTAAVGSDGSVSLTPGWLGPSHE